MQLFVKIYQNGDVSVKPLQDMPALLEQKIYHAIKDAVDEFNNKQ